MKWVERYKRGWGLIWLLVTAIFVFTRVFNFMALPIFIDEALYVRWIDAMTVNARVNILLPLVEDGQPPLFFVGGALLKWILGWSDSLMVLRLMSIIFGFLTMIGGMGLTWEISKSRLATLIFIACYLTSPFVLWYDRLGMRDSAVSWVMVYSLWSINKWYKTGGRKWLWLTGGLLMLGILIKSISWLILISVIIFVLFSQRTKKLIDWISLLVPVCMVSAMFIWTNTYPYLVQKNTIFVIDNLKLFITLRNNGYHSLVWLWQYLTPIVFVALGLLIINRYKKFDKSNLINYFVIILPIFIEVIVARIFFPRYFLFVAVGLLVILAKELGLLFSKTKKIVILMTFWGLSIWPVIYCLIIIFDPVKAPLPKIEKWQYISGWPSGFGVKEMTAFLVSYQPDYILTEESDLLRTGLGYYQKELAKKTLVLSESILFTDLAKAGIDASMLQNNKVVIALHIKQALPEWFRGEKVFEYIKPNQGDRLLVYRLR